MLQACEMVGMHGRERLEFGELKVLLHRWTRHVFVARTQQTQLHKLNIFFLLHKGTQHAVGFLQARKAVVLL
jgi:hypothetical protein